MIHAIRRAACRFASFLIVLSFAQLGNTQEHGHAIDGENAAGNVGIEKALEKILQRLEGLENRLKALELKVEGAREGENIKLDASKSSSMVPNVNWSAPRRPALVTPGRSHVSGVEYGMKVDAIEREYRRTQLDPMKRIPLQLNPSEFLLSDPKRFRLNSSTFRR